MHLQTGSVIVRRRQHLRTGAPIARLGNTGNTTDPHLHFGIHDGPNPFMSNALPFEIDQFTLQGNISAASTPTHLITFGRLAAQRRAYPLVYSVSSFAARR